MQFLMECFVLVMLVLAAYCVSELRRCRREIDGLKDWVRNLNSRVEVGEIEARGNQRESAVAPPQYGGSEQGPPIPAAWPYANEPDAPSPWPYEHGVSSSWPSANAPVAPASWPYESGASTPLSPAPERPPVPGRPPVPIPSPGQPPVPPGMMPAAPAAFAAMPEDGDLAERSDSLEGTFGRNVIGLAAVLLVFLGLVFLGILVIPTLGNEVRCALMWLLSLVLASAGLAVARHRVSAFSISLLGAGMGAIFISVLMTHVYFRYLSEVPAFGLMLAWMAACMVLVRRFESTALSVLVHMGMVISVCFSYSFGFSETRLPLVITYQTLSCTLVVAGSVLCLRRTYRYGLLVSLVLTLIASLFMRDYFGVGGMGSRDTSLSTPIAVAFFLQFAGASVLSLLLALSGKEEEERDVTTTLYAMGKLAWFGVLLVDVCAVARQLILQASGLSAGTVPPGNDAARAVMLAEAHSTLIGIACLAAGVALILWLMRRRLVDAGLGKLSLCLLGGMAAFLLLLRYLSTHLSLLPQPNLSYVVLVAVYFYVLAYAMHDSAYASIGDVTLGLDALLMLTSGYGELVERAGVGTAFTYVVMLTALAYLSWRIRSRVVEALGGDAEAPRLRPRMLTCLAVAELSIHIIVNAAGYQHAQEIVAGILAVLLVGVYALQAWRRRVASGTFWMGAAVNELAVSALVSLWALTGDAAGLLPGRPNSPDTYAYVPSLIILMALVGLRLWDFLSERPRPTEALQVSEGIVFSLLGLALTQCSTAQMDIPFAAGIVVMVTALICIIVGFKALLRALRLYGLTIVIVCVFRLVLVDAAFLSPVARVVSFVIGGAICFAISALYSRAEQRIRGRVGEGGE